MIQLTFQGTTKCDYDASPLGKLLIPVEIEGIRATALVDTGAPYLVCAPEVAEQIAFSGELERTSLSTRLGKVTGPLRRGRVRLIAANGGEGIEFEATIFVPENEEWRDKPSFLGFYCCLERIRFAVDPHKDMFYFADAGAD